MSKLVCIETFTDRKSADMAKSILDAHEIKASVSYDDVGGARPALGFTSGGAKLFVLETNVAKAMEVLQTESPKSTHRDTSRQF